MTTLKNAGNAPLQQLETTLEEYLVKKAPALPDNIKEIIVKFAPWITLILLIMALPAVLILFGIGSFMMPVSYMGGFRTGNTYTLSMIVLAISLVLEALAIPGLMKRTRQGWNLVFYSTLVSTVSNIISFNIGSLIIGTLISLYILFQVKSYYK